MLFVICCLGLAVLSDVKGQTNLYSARIHYTAIVFVLVLWDKMNWPPSIIIFRYGDGNDWRCVRQETQRSQDHGLFSGGHRQKETNIGPQLVSFLSAHTCKGMNSSRLQVQLNILGSSWDSYMWYTFVHYQFGGLLNITYYPPAKHFIWPSTFVITSMHHAHAACTLCAQLRDAHVRWHTWDYFCAWINMSLVVVCHFGNELSIYLVRHDHWWPLTIK